MANDTPKPPQLPLSAEETDAFVRSRGYAPKTPTSGYQFGEHRCATAKCRADRYLFKYEVSVEPARFRVKSNHVRCDRCSQLYELTVTEDSAGGHVSARPFVD